MTNLVQPSSLYRKGVSFLSRIIGTKKRDIPPAAEDDLSEAETSRMSVDTSRSIGFVPRHPAPGRYLRIRAHYKKDKTFNRVFLAQELDGAGSAQKVSKRRSSISTSSIKHEDAAGKAVWALAFSKDGKYLAAAGQDMKVRVWAVISTPAERETAVGEYDGSQDDLQSPRLKAPVFKSKPFQVFEGHTGSVLDLSWSKV